MTNEIPELRVKQLECSLYIHHKYGIEILEMEFIDLDWFIADIFFNLYDENLTHEEIDEIKSMISAI
jgi:hypothetical protein